MKTTSSAPSVGTGENGKRIGDMKKDLCCYHTVERQLQLFVSFDHFAKLKLLWVNVAGVSVSLPNLAVLPESHLPPCRDQGLFEAAWRAAGSWTGQVKIWTGLLRGQVTISSRANSGPWQHPLKSNGFNVVPPHASMTVSCLKVKCLVSTSSKRQATLPKHHLGHLRHTRDCQLWHRACKRPKTCGEAADGQAGSLGHLKCH